MQINLYEPIFTPKVYFKKRKLCSVCFPENNLSVVVPVYSIVSYFCMGSISDYCTGIKSLICESGVKTDLSSHLLCLPVYHSCQVEHRCTRSSSQHTDKNLIFYLPPTSCLHSLHTLHRTALHSSCNLICKTPCTKTTQQGTISRISSPGLQDFTYS